MIGTLEKTDELKIDELKTIKQEKDTWILELPAEICRKEGFAEGTIVSLTIKNGGIQASYIHPSIEARESAERFVSKYADFMREMQKVD